MNQRQLTRHQGRIPRLLFHIKRAKLKKQPDRVKTFEAELERRKFELLAAGHKDFLNKLLQVRLNANTPVALPPTPRPSEPRPDE